jgi:hypothetical protein
MEMGSRRKRSSDCDGNNEIEIRRWQWGAGDRDQAMARKIRRFEGPMPSGVWNWRRLNDEVTKTLITF